MTALALAASSPSTPSCLLAVGLNHASAPLDLRGRYAVPVDRLASTLQGLREHLLARGAPATGLTLLSTCNRTELYLGGSDAADLLAPVETWFAAQGGAGPDDLRPHRYVHQDADVARHAFRVAAGLDSAVLGEPQILGQLKTAVRTADAAGMLGGTLQQLFQRSFAVAKAVRSGTEIGAHPVSLAAAAVRIALQLFGDLSQQRVLFIGAGEMIDLVATHLAARAPAAIAVANRSLERAEALAGRLGGTALPLVGLDRRLHEFDLIVSCTASSLPLVGLGAVQRALRARRRRPMLMFDLAVPRDIEAEVGGLDDVYLYTVDDLASRAAEGGERRLAAVQAAESLVDAGVDHFRLWLARRASVPLVQAVLAQGESWREQELQRARRALTRGAPVDEVLQLLSATLTRKLLHGALAGLHHSKGEEHAAWTDAAQRCFLRSDAHGAG
ncbi:glutamyl-tRNA reductase [Sphaerotilus mobilis]|uniref:Glutamyl-tRNA reductase n=1 Tax=Sphaerotilus mobilis TaxID=47994 RepID=A0A4Q7LWN7_9BURK|nr:glutamyl-tRNA reductase [Sphaerotilus mobilis]RZS58538.1 glutamyl-tRNA reductase [Sphaerotilus mobilis]